MKLSPLACALCLAGSALWGALKPTPEDARKFIDDVEQKLLVLGVDSGRADWVRSTYITDDTELLAALPDERAIKATVQYAKESTTFDGLKLDPVTARNKLLKLSLTSLPISCSFSFIARCGRRPAAPRPSTAVLSTATRPRERG